MALFQITEMRVKSYGVRELRAQRHSVGALHRDIPAYTQRSVHTEAPRAGLCAPSLLLQAASHPEGVGGLHPTECLPRKGNGVG